MKGCGAPIDGGQSYSEKCGRRGLYSEKIEYCRSCLSKMVREAFVDGCMNGGMEKEAAECEFNNSEYSGIARVRK